MAYLIENSASKYANNMSSYRRETTAVQVIYDNYYKCVTQFNTCALKNPSYSKIGNVNVRNVITHL